MKLLILFTHVFCLQEGIFGHPWMRIYRPTSGTKIQELEEKFGKFLSARPKLGPADRFNPLKKKSDRFFCSLSPSSREYCCEIILKTPTMGFLETDREFLKSKRCEKFEIKNVKIPNPNTPPTVEAFQCPPTRMVNQPHFLTEGGNFEDAPLLYVLQREPGDSKIHVVAIATNIPKQ